MWNSISKRAKEHARNGVYSPTPQPDQWLRRKRSDQPDFSSSLNVEIGKKLIESAARAAAAPAWDSGHSASTRRRAFGKQAIHVVLTVSALMPASSAAYRYQCLVR